ncbi:MAG: caspase family protein [Paracoccaceae bacterium]
MSGFSTLISMRIARIWAVVLMFAVPGMGIAEPSKMALVVGNAAYEAAPGLTTATHDAQDVAGALRGLGFEVTLLTDVSSDVFWVVLETFAAKSKAADTVVFYYAGHAFQMGGVNHLVPVAARLDSEQAIRDETWTLDAIAEQLRGGAGQVLIFLDACRTNPLPAVLRADQGLAQFDGGTGTFVAFATRPGAVAYDRVTDARNSPFTAALLKRIGVAGQSISDLMIGVRNDVEEATGGQQVPWDQSSLRAQVFLAPKADGPALPELEFAADSAVVINTRQVAAVPGAAAADVPRLAAVEVGRVVAPVSDAARIAGVDVAVRVPGVTPDPPPAFATERELHAAIQTELKRIGCYTRAIDGDWGRGSQGGLERYYAANKIKAADVEGGVFAPTEAAWKLLLDAPEKTCTYVAPVPVKKKAVAKTKAKPKKPAVVAKKPAPVKKRVSNGY